ncbi:hypothetical protein [Microbacterium atlanticum]|uniref:hypothetical protein n=1 Tax=Microbacterium atlanticum TaxID=2782168 RepID=UPI00188785D1|nr:hypothetical protein [Microbacterium atlanticum]
MTRARTGAAGDDDPDEHVIHEEWESVGIRRAPRIGRIMISGIVFGVVAAGVLTAMAAFSEEPGGPLSTGASGFLRVFGVMAVVCVGFGLLVAGLIVIVLDRVVGSRDRPAIAEHSTSLSDDLVSPVTDDVPQWVRDREIIEAERGEGSGPHLPATDDPSGRLPKG